MSSAKFEKPATVTWSTLGPSDEPMPANTRDFHTLREAVLYVRTLPRGARAKMTVRSGGRSCDAVDVEELERELRRR